MAQKKHALKLLILPLIALLLLLVALLARGASAAQYYQVPASGCIRINEWSVSKDVTNSYSLAAFVPTNTSGEWSSAYTYPPATLSYAASTNHNACYQNDVWLFTSCNAPISLVQTCSGNYCTGGPGAAVYSYTACSGSTCGSSLVENCDWSGHCDSSCTTNCYCYAYSGYCASNGTECQNDYHSCNNYCDGGSDACCHY